MDTSLVLALGFLLAPGLVLMCLGFFLQKALRAASFILATFMWTIIGVAFPALTDLSVPALGYAFFVIAGFNGVCFAASCYELFIESHVEPFERELEADEYPY